MTHRGTFLEGFAAILPLWLGMAPFGFAYAVTARGAGLSLWDTQLMSVVVFAGGAQFSAAGLFLVGAPGYSIILTTFLMNARHFLYGLSLGQRLPLSRSRQFLAAHFLTDEAFGVSVAREGLSFPFLLGAELSVFVVWNLSTLAGSLASRGIPDPLALGVDFVFPLAFLALLIPLLKGTTELMVAILAGLGAFVASQFLDSGLTILLVGVGGALLGAWLETLRERKRLEAQP